MKTKSSAVARVRLVRDKERQRRTLTITPLQVISLAHACGIYDAESFVATERKKWRA